MKMILRPYQYIYVSRNEHEILFYNIVKNRIYTYQIPFEEYIIKGGNIIFNGENQYSSALHSIFETEQLGEKIVSSKIFCCNQYDILKEGFKISITNHDIISSDISKYVLQITAYIDSVLFPKRNSWEEEYSAPDFLTKLSSFMRQYSNLQKIQLVVKKFSLQIIEPFIAEFYTTHSLEIICSTANLQYIKKLKRKYPELTSADLVQQTKKWCADSGGHQTGGAVDVQLWYQGRIADCGTPYLSTSPDSETAEINRLSPEAMTNRRLLLQTMTEAGFVNYPAEWWHYCFGDQLYAAYHGEKCAFYGEIELYTPNSGENC